MFITIFTAIVAISCSKGTSNASSEDDTASNSSGFVDTKTNAIFIRANQQSVLTPLPSVVETETLAEGTIESAEDLPGGGLISVPIVTETNPSVSNFYQIIIQGTLANGEAFQIYFEENDIVITEENGSFTLTVVIPTTFFSNAISFKIFTSDEPITSPPGFAPPAYYELALRNPRLATYTKSGGDYSLRWFEPLEGFSLASSEYLIVYTSDGSIPSECSDQDASLVTTSETTHQFSSLPESNVSFLLCSRDGSTTSTGTVLRQVSEFPCGPQSYVYPSSSSLVGYSLLCTETPNYIDVPEEPSNLGATVNSATEISLSWEDNSSTETGFEIQRSVDATNYTVVTTTAADAVSYVDSGLSPSTQYYYRVRACESDSCSTVAAVSATTTAAVHIVFMTSTGHTGDLGGLSGADSICQTAGDSSSFASSTWKAILSNETVNAIDRIQIIGSIVNGNGDPVAGDATTFWSGVSANLMNWTELGTQDGGGSPWTGTVGGGTKATGDTCDNWGSSDSGDYGHYGASTILGGWLDFDRDTCDQSFRLYCINYQ